MLGAGVRLATWNAGCGETALAANGELIQHALLRAQQAASGHQSVGGEYRYGFAGQFMNVLVSQLEKHGNAEVSGVDCVKIHGNILKVKSD